MQHMHAPIKVFCSYAHADRAFFELLEAHLSSLKQQKLITTWDDRQITPGSDWAQVIDANLNSADVILLLISPSFLASNYCSGVEMKRALERHKANEARVVPILLCPVDWEGTPLKRLQVLPTDAKPITIWDNQNAAFADVVTGIRRAIDDVPKLVACAPHSILPPIWTIPYPCNHFFFGRDDVLRRISAQFQAGEATALSQPQAISGLGGVGKTQIAIEYAYRHCQDYQAVLWARAESTDALVSSYTAIATQLNLPEKDARDQTCVVDAVKHWLHTHQAWLLILDNADDLTLVPDFLPPAISGHLLLTTRAQAIGELAHRIEVKTFSLEQGAWFLLRRARLLSPDAQLAAASPADQREAMQIAENLGGLPLALDQAGAYLEETGCSLAEYQQVYQQRRSDLLKERRGLVSYHPDPVATTWSLSFAQVEQKHPAAADLLRLCAFLAPDAIPLELLMQGAKHLGPLLEPVLTDTYQLNQVIEALRAYSLLHRDPGAKALSIHRLVQAVLQDMITEDEKAAWKRRVVQVLNILYPSVTHEVWGQCERLTSHVLLYANVTINHAYELELAALLKKTADYLSERAQYEQAKPLYQRALQIRELTLGTEHPEVAQLQHHLALLYQRQGKYELAESLYQRALDIREQVLGAEHLDIAQSVNGLATLYYIQGKYELAKPLFQRALDIRQQVLGTEHPDVAGSLHDLASLYDKQGKYEQAEPLYLHALQIFEQALQAELPCVALSLNSLAILYYEQGKYELAEPLYLRALDIREQTLGTEHPDVARSLNGLANLYLERGRYELAGSLYQRALDIREQTLGTEHPDVARSLNNLGNLYTVQGKYELAEPLYLRALQTFEQALQADHPNVTYPLINLADLYTMQGKYELAEPLYLRALHVREQTLGTEHPDVARSLNRLANLYTAQGRYELAEPLYLRALYLQEQVLGAKHPDMARSLNGLANLYTAQGRYELAEPLYIRAFSIRQQQLGGSQHPDIAESLYDMAHFFHMKQETTKACSLYQQALRLLEQVLGTEHPKTVKARNSYTNLLQEIGHPERAMVFEQIKNSEFTSDA
jgi:tetratricopeptide (TPR) repeat protein